MSGKTGQTLVFRRARSPRERRRDDARASDALEDARNRSAPSRGARAVSIVASNASTRPSGPGDAAKASAGCGRRRRKSRGGCRIHVPSGLVEPGANTARGRVALPVLLEVRIGDLVVVGHHLGVSPLTPRDAKRDEGVRRGEVLPLNERNEEREMVSKFAGRMSRLDARCASETASRSGRAFDGFRPRLRDSRQGRPQARDRLHQPVAHRARAGDPRCRHRAQVRGSEGAAEKRSRHHSCVRTSRPHEYSRAPPPFAGPTPSTGGPSSAPSAARSSSARTTWSSARA